MDRYVFYIVCTILLSGFIRQGEGRVDDAVYIGCYRDDWIRALDENDHETSSAMTHELCFDRCRSSSSPYAGLQHSKQCFCGSNYDLYDLLDESLCYAPCSGNTEEICGGGWANSVYLLVYRKTACESQTLKLDCKSHSINIHGASYGAHPEDPQCNTEATVKCDAEDSVSIVREKCDGKHLCNVDATNEVFGDPCRGIAKYLTVIYSCPKDLQDNLMDKTSLGPTFSPTTDTLTTKSGQMSIQMTVERRVARNLNYLTAETIFSWHFNEPIGQLQVIIDWGDGMTDERDVLPNLSSKLSVLHTYESCGRYKVFGSVLGDDYELYSHEETVYVMEPIEEMTLTAIGEDGIIIESGAQVNQNTTIFFTANVTPNQTVCYTFIWEVYGPQNLTLTENTENVKFQFIHRGSYFVAASVSNNISYATSSSSIFVIPPVKLNCQSLSPVGVSTTCVIQTLASPYDLSLIAQFGDGPPSEIVIVKGETDIELQHTYASVGRYNVTIYFGDGNYIRNEVTITQAPCALSSPFIQGASNDEATPVIYQREAQIKLSSSSDFICSEKMSLTFQWFLFNLNEESEKNLIPSLPLLLTNTSELIIPSHALESSPYRILLQVTLRDEEGKYFDQRESQGWIKIEKSDLVAIIDGGSMRTVGVDTSIVLDGSRSYDPDSHVTEDDPLLTFSWSCQSESDIFSHESSSSFVCDGSTLTTDPTLLIASDSVTSPVSVEFHLNIRKDGRSASAIQTIQFVSGDVLQVAVRCLQNCDVYLKPTSKLVLQATCLDCAIYTSAMSYSWGIYKEEQSKKIKLKSFNWGEKSMTGKNQEFLVLKPEAIIDLFPGIYVLEVTGTSESVRGQSGYRIRVNIPPENGTCFVNPQNGTTLKTRFKVTCHGFVDPDAPLTYTLYRTAPGGTVFLLSSSSSRDFASVFLPPGNETDNFFLHLMVKISDRYSSSSFVHLQVKVSPITVDGDIGEFLKNFTMGSTSLLGNMLTAGNTEAANQFMMSAAMLLNAQSNRQDESDFETKIKIRASLVQSLSDLSIQTLETLEMTSASMVAVTEFNQELDTETQVNAVSLLSRLTSYMKKETASNKEFTSQHVEHTSKLLSHGLSNLLGTSLQNYNEITANDNHTGNKQKQRHVISSAVKSMETIQDALLTKKIPGETATSITTESFVLSVIKQTAEKFVEVQDIPPTTSGWFQLPKDVTFYQNVTKSNQTNGVIDIQVIDIPVNPFTSNFGESNVVTSGVMGLKLKTNDDEIKVSELDDNSISVMLQQTTVDPIPDVFYLTAGSVVSLTINVTGATPQGRHLQLSLVPSTPISPISVCLLNITTANVSVEETCVHNFNLPHTSGTVSASLEANYTWIGHFIPQIGDVIQLHVKVGDVPNPEEWLDSSLNLSVYSSSPACLFWDDVEESWNHKGCVPGPLSDPWQSHCLCNHLSFFGSSMFVRPNKIDLIADAKLFLTFVNNPLVVCTVATIFGVYLVTILWAYRKDKQDRVNAQITVLDDNDPFDHYRYLVTVVTGWRRGASTTANVILTLQGSKMDSDPHILSNTSHKILQAGNHDTFLLTTRSSLGEVVAIRLWHDNGGAHPEWFVSHVNVHDLERNAHYLFICNSWLASNIDEGKIDRTFDIATQEELGQFGSLFLSQTSSDFQDEHLWFSVFTRPPRSSFTRCQRVSCCFSLLMTAMMTNIMFYGIPSDPGEQVLDFGALRITMQEIIIGIEGAIIAFPINLIIVSIFRKARPASQHHPSDLYKLEGKRHSHDDESVADSTSAKHFSSRSSLPDGRDIEIDITDNNEEILTGEFYACPGDGPLRYQRSATEVETKSVSSTEEDKLKSKHNQLLYVKLMTLVEDLESMDPSCFSSGEEYQKTVTEARALVLTAVSIATPSSTSYDTSIDDANDSDSKEKEDSWFNWLWRQPQTAKRKDGRKGLPHWFIYIGWLLLWATYLTSAYVTMLYGLKYGKQRSLDWLISLFVSTFQSIFITQPLKIILFAVFLSLIFRRWDVEDDGADEIEEQNIDNAEQIHEKLVKTKEVDLRYKPPAADNVEVHRKLKKEEKHMYALLHEIFGYFLFIWLLVIITYSRRDRYAYYLTKNIKNRYFEGNKLYNLNLTHFSGFFVWMEGAVIPNLYGTSPYEADTHSNLIGGVRIRQLRVRPDSCTLAPMIEGTISDCWSAYSRQSEDARFFNLSWQRPLESMSEDKISKEYLTPWMYQTGLSHPYWGKITTYQEGGFVWYLENNLVDAESQLREMKAKRWLDEHTRAIFLDWTVFNANINMFGVVTCLLETPAGGGILKTYSIHSVRLYRSASNTSLFVTICEVTFSLSLLYYMYREYGQWKTLRASYWTSIWNWLEVSIIINAIVMIVMYIIQLVYIKHLFEDFRKNPSQFFDFRMGAMMENNLTYSSAFLVILSTVKCLHLLRLNPRMYLLTSVVFKSASEVLGFMFMIFLLICTFSLFLTLHVGSQMKDYRSFGNSFITLFNSISGNFEVNELRIVSRTLGPWIVFIFQFVAFFVFFDLLISALNENMSFVRRFPKISKDGILGLILVSKILSFFGIHKKVKPLYRKSDSEDL